MLRSPQLLLLLLLPLLAQRALSASAGSSSSALAARPLPESGARRLAYSYAGDPSTSATDQATGLTYGINASGPTSFAAYLSSISPFSASGAGFQYIFTTPALIRSTPITSNAASGRQGGGANVGFFNGFLTLAGSYAGVWFDMGLASPGCLNQPSAMRNTMLLLKCGASGVPATAYEAPNCNYVVTVTVRALTLSPSHSFCSASSTMKQYSTPSLLCPLSHPLPGPQNLWL